MAKSLASAASLLDFPATNPITPKPSSTRSVKIGVIGCGYWGPKLVRNFSHASGCEVVAVSDQNPEQLQRIAEDYPAIPGVVDYRTLLDDPDIEAVAISTPVSTHFNIAWDALNAGKHVLVEKPMAASLREAELLVDLAEKRGCMLMVDHTYLFTGAVEKMREVVRSGELGDVLYFDSTRINLGLFQHDVNVVWDLAPHDLSILLHVLDKKPTAVSAIGTAHAGAGQENLAYLTLSFDDNTLAHFHVNWLAPRKVRQIIIGGEKKMLVFDDMESNEKIKIYDKGISVEKCDREAVYQTMVHYRVGDMLAPQLDPGEALLKECTYFAKCIREKITPHNDGYAGLEVVRILHAATQSMYENGKRVYVV